MHLRWTTVALLLLWGLLPSHPRCAADPPTVELVSPVGAVRRQEMRTYEVRARDPAALNGCVVVFRWTTGQTGFEIGPGGQAAVGTLPAVLVRSLRVGEVVSWSIHPPFDPADRNKPPLAQGTFSRAADFPANPPGDGTALPAIDPRQAAALRDLAGRIGRSLPNRPLPLPHEVGRGYGGTGLLFPRGRVLKSNLRWYGVEMPLNAQGRLTFRRDGELLHQHVIAEDDHNALAYLPQEVIAAAQVGARIDWTLETSEGGSVSASFTVIDDPVVAAQVEALRVDPRLSRQSHWVRCALISEAYLARGHHADALQHALLTLSAYEGGPGFGGAAAPTFFRLKFFFDPPAAWEPGGFEASLPARSALAAMRHLDLVRTDRSFRLMRESVWVSPDEAAQRTRAFSRHVRGDWANWQGDRPQTTFALLSTACDSPVGRAWMLDELLVAGGPALARFADALPSEDLSHYEGRARVVFSMGRWHARCGRLSQAVGALRSIQGLSDGLFSYRVRITLAHLLRKRGDVSGSMRAFREAARIATTFSFDPCAQDALAGAERAALTLGTYPALVDIVERRMALDEAGGKPYLAIRRRADLGVRAYRSGRLGDAVRLLREAHAACDGENATKYTVARINLSLGAALVDVGDWPEALAALHAAHDAMDAEHAPGLKGDAALALGIAYTQLGAFPKAEAMFDAAQRLLLMEGDKVGQAHVVASRANALAAQDQHDPARALYEAAIESFQALGDARSVARVRCALGDLLLRRRQYAQALRVSRDGATGADASQDAEAGVIARANAGEALLGLGEIASGKTALQDALRMAREADYVPLIAEQEGRLARALLREGKPREALARVRAGSKELDRMVRGLGSSLGPSARDRSAVLFSVGIEAAFRQGDAEALFAILERGRAQSLTEGLLGRDAIRAKAVDPDLQERARVARGLLRKATDALAAARARAANDLTQLEAAYHRARNYYTDLAERIVRAASGAAPMVRPPDRTLADVEARLRADEALVLYGFSESRAIALVIEPGTARMIDLGARHTIESACALVLERGERPGSRGLSLPDRPKEPGQEANDAADALRAQVIRPLQLGRGIERVLISPSGVLGYVPFGMLLPQRSVTCVPSATTLLLLLDKQAERGTGVLALGDPDYETEDRASTRAVQARAGLYRLTRLPATRIEAEAVGSVALLGKQATKERLELRLASRERWRAVHLACHGLVDSERPALCALALTADAEHDGMLTALDVMRIPFRADLVALSACETGRGKIYNTEGVVGLTSAFLLAGASRVLSSQWKVDDNATRALMVKFYELWNPAGGRGRDADSALRQAQAHVRAQSRWKHPYYWAAWTLWGLPR